MVPGEAFGTNEHVRISYATSMKELERGLDRMHKFIAAQVVNGDPSALAPSFRPNACGDARSFSRGFRTKRRKSAKSGSRLQASCRCW